jgi:hypothetical protein
MVNVRNKGRVILSDISDNMFMKNKHDIDAIRTRLKECLDESGISMRAASLAAGTGPGYVHSFLKEDTEPTITKLSEICSSNGISFSYVVFGIEMSPGVRRLLDALEKDPQKLESVLALLG